MSFNLVNRNGEFLPDPELGNLARILGELDGPADPEHPDVSLVHESGWALSAFPNGLLVWENAEWDGPPRHRTRVPRLDVERLWRALAAGEIAVVEAYGWDPGYGSPS